jgi:peptidoglycan/LPS O-acetylase OafA/YrhL
MFSFKAEYMKRLEALDGLRAISILLVLATHMLPLGPKSWRLNETTGPMGMCLFFALSGFLITSNLLSSQTVYSFFVRRMTRILPLAYLYLAVCFLFVTYQPVKLFGNLVFIENYDRSFMDDLNSHFWSLCVEMHFYVAIGLIFAALGKRGLMLIIPICAAVTALRILDHSYIDSKTHLKVDEILAGAAVAIFYHFGWLKFRASPWLLVLACIFWAVCSSPLMGAFQYFRPYTSAVILALVICLGPGLLESVLSSRPARYVASISFALYVVHPLTIYDWMNQGSTFERYALKRPISFAATFLLAHLSTFYWESRWIEWGKSLARRPQQNTHDRAFGPR